MYYGSHLVLIRLVTPILLSWYSLSDVFSHPSPHFCTLSCPGLLESITSLAVPDILMIITTSLAVPVILVIRPISWPSLEDVSRWHVHRHRSLIETDSTIFLAVPTIHVILTWTRTSWPWTVMSCCDVHSHRLLILLGVKLELTA